MNAKTQTESFGSTDLVELWRLIDKWLLDVQKQGRVEVSNVATWTTLHGNFFAIVFYIKFP